MSGAFAMDPEFIQTVGESRNLPRSVVFATRCLVTFTVLFTVVVTLTVFGRELSALQTILMMATAGAFLAWTLVRSPGLIYSSLEFRTTNEVVRNTSGIWLFLLVQLALAQSTIYVTTGTEAVMLLWLLFLPTANLATILLPRRQMLAVAGLCLLLDSIALRHVLGWESFQPKVAQFILSLGIVMTVTVFMIRTVKARQDAAQLAQELKFAYLRLRESAIQAEEFAASRERNRLAREIHDTIGHRLTVVNVQLEVALTMLERAPGTARDAINKSQSMIQEGLQEIRVSVGELRSSPVDRSLVEALQRAVTEVDTMECPVEFHVLGESRKLAQKPHLCLFRAGQEALTNAKRHSGATLISVTLDYRSPDEVLVIVKDNGVGSDSIREGFGLLGIGERALDVDGKMNISTSVGRGFEMTVRVPG